MQCEIAKRFFDMLSAINTAQKVPREYCGGLVLYPSEMELLARIDENPACNISVLSAKAGVTKSAVTQMSTKLLEKGLIEPYQSPKNKKEKFFRLTCAGKQARKDHIEYNRAAAEGLQNYLCSLTEEEKRTILVFMEKMKRYMPVCAFPCACGCGESLCFLTTERKRMEE